jgi:hypothetical protein
VRQQRKYRLVYAQYYCRRCNRYLSADTSHYAPPKCHYSPLVVNAAVDLVVLRKSSYRVASEEMWLRHVVRVPFATIQNWVEARR